MCKQKMRALSYIGAKKSRFPLNLTDRHTYIQRTDIIVYRVASLLKRRETKGGKKADINV